MTVPTTSLSNEAIGDTWKTADPEKIRDRSRTSGFDLLKMTLGLATASVGVFLVNLLNKFDPPLSGFQKPALIAAILFMAAAVAAGMGAWAADAFFYKSWADILETKKGASREKRERAKRMRGYLLLLLGSLFLMGVLSAAAFSLLRASVA